MNAKRLTALALAALMAASTTSVALASEKVEYDLDFEQGVYYRYDEGEGRIVKADPDYTFAPGEKIYVRVEENTQGTKFPNKKSYDAYAEWKLGDSWVKDIDLVYKKGEVATSTTTENYYSIKGVGTLQGWNVDSTKTSETLDNLKAQLAKDNNFTNAVSTYIQTNYPTKNGYKLTADGTFKETLGGFGITSGTKNGFFYKDKFYATATDAGLEAISNSGTYRTNSIYFKTIDDVLAYFEFSQYNASPDGGQVYVEANVSGKTWGVASSSPSPECTQTATTANLTDFVTVEHGGKMYWIKKANLVDGIKAINASANELQAVGSGDIDTYYFDKNTATAHNSKGYDLVEKASATPGDVTVHSYNGTDYDSESKAMTAAGVEAYNGPVNQKDGKVISTTAAEEAANKVVKADLDKSIKYESKTITNTTPQYEYWVEISTKSSNSTKENDLVGTLYTGTNKNSAKDGDSFRLEVTLSNQSNNSGDKNDYKDATDYVTIEDGERAIVSFADDASDEFEVEFGDDARFVFNARGQSKLNLAYNTKYDKDFAYDYDDANIDFLTFEGEPTTNRTGTLYIYADEDSYIYEVTPRGAKKINGAKYNHDEEAWEIRTRNLTSYAISDKKLKTVDQMENSSSSNSSNKPGNNKPGSNKPGNNNDKPNPDTGR